MIVQPNFPDHHKTRQLVLELGGDELAPLYVLRLWAHCQNQKRSRFPKMSATALCAICCAKCSPEQLWLALQNAGFVKLRGDVLIVHEWDDYNQSLLTSWSNGKKGGRKRKAQSLPSGQPAENPRVSGGVGDREEKIEKRREDREEEGAHAAPLVPLLLNVSEFLEPFAQWQAIRRKGKKPKSGWDDYFARQLAWLEPFGLSTAIEIVSTSARNEWQGLFEPKGISRSKQPTGRCMSFA